MTRYSSECCAWVLRAHQTSSRQDLIVGLRGVALQAGTRAQVSSAGGCIGKDALWEDRLVSWGNGVFLLSLEGSRTLPYPRAALFLPSVRDSNVSKRKPSERFLSSCS